MRFLKALVIAMGVLIVAATVALVVLVVQRSGGSSVASSPASLGQPAGPGTAGSAGAAKTKSYRVGQRGWAQREGLGLELEVFRRLLKDSTVPGLLRPMFSGWMCCAVCPRMNSRPLPWQSAWFSKTALSNWCPKGFGPAHTSNPDLIQDEGGITFFDTPIPSIESLLQMKALKCHSSQKL